MNEQLQSDFDKIIKTSKISEEEIQIKKDFLNKFIESGFPNRKQEDWKFLDISQIIKKNIKEAISLNKWLVSPSKHFWKSRIFQRFKYAKNVQYKRAVVNSFILP